MEAQLHTHFKDLITNNQLAHAYLFTGEDQEGKDALIIDIIQQLALRSSTEDSGDKASLLERISDKQYADAVYIQPDGQWIRVDQIRELRQWLLTSPVEGNIKVAVIEEAQRMNPSSANALLTVLEEPVEGVYLFLLAPNESNILPTILSRVQRYHIQEVDTDVQVKAWVEDGVSEGHAAILARLSSGVQARLLSDYDKEECDRYFNAWNYFYSLLIAKDPLAFVSVQTHLKDYLSTQQALDGADYLLLLVHSSLMLSQSLESSSSVPLVQTYFINNLLKKVDVHLDDLLHLGHLLLQTKQRVTANVSGQLAYEQLVLEFIQL